MYVLVKILLSISFNKEMLKRLQSDDKTKAAQSIGLVPMNLNSQEKIATPINQTFTLFPNLPLELQRKIWEFTAVPVPRAIEIQSKYKKNTNKYVTSFYEKVSIQRRIRYYTITSPIPTNLLHVCSESRNIALRNYSFRTFFRRPFYLNEDTDILWVRGPAIFGFLTRDGSIITHCPREEGTFHHLVSKHKFRHLAIDYQAQREPFPIWSNFFPGQRNRDWNVCFWSHYILEGLAIEKIYLVYTKTGRAEDGAGGSGECREKNVTVVIPGMFVWYCRATELRRRLGLGFKAPPVEAILDTELMQQFH
ncbi:uncharacterized protein Bfra_006962 [Botrytis fragariae]|uniref:2EXR domain-containing protein n=1 Tax=Botrytis fragariae TaxID=1964551 RepID=A0A8H6ECY4_9HELO|nr:uncharacterized protein Bfra_006962 [Botrytis fragariae]KAF5867764.1 hypothetical protein Bfra_006962 [Botrytis fragariae]